MTADAIAQLQNDLAAARALLRTSWHALRSYQYGNSAPDLAEEIADRIDAALAGKDAP